VASRAPSTAAVRRRRRRGQGGAGRSTLPGREHTRQRPGAHHEGRAGGVRDARRQGIPNEFKFSSVDEPCWVSSDGMDRICNDCEVRLKIVGTVIDNTEIVRSMRMADCGGGASWRQLCGALRVCRSKLNCAGADRRARPRTFCALVSPTHSARVKNNRLWPLPGPHQAHQRLGLFASGARSSPS